MKSRDKFNIYMQLHRIDGIEPKAVWQDLKFGLENMKEITQKVDKVALVTDKNWVQKLAEISYSFVPGIELKSFAFEKSPEAKKWVVD
jgi:glycyl-tRNA synthetase alpha subunit